MITENALRVQPVEVELSREVALQLDAAYQARSVGTIKSILETIEDSRELKKGIDYVYERCANSQTLGDDLSWSILKGLIKERIYPTTFSEDAMNMAIVHCDDEVVEFLGSKILITPYMFELLANSQFTISEETWQYVIHDPTETLDARLAKAEKIAHYLLETYDRQNPIPVLPVITSTASAEQKYKMLFAPPLEGTNDSQVGLLMAKLKMQGIKVQLDKEAKPEERALQRQVLNALQDGVNLMRPNKDLGGEGGYPVLTTKDGKRVGVMRRWHDRLAYELDHGHFAGVPPTIPLSIPGMKFDYMQAWVEEATHETVEQRDTHETQAIGIFDMRFGNQDRNTGNTLVATREGQKFSIPIDHDHMPTSFYHCHSMPFVRYLNCPLSTQAKNYITAIDIEKDADIMRKFKVNENVILSMKMRSTVLKMGLEKNLKLKHYEHIFAMYQKKWLKIVTALPIQTEEAIQQALQTEFEMACSVVLDRIKRTKQRILVSGYFTKDFHLK